MSPYRKSARPADFFVRQGARVRVACSFHERLAQWWWGGFRPAAWHGRVGTVLRGATYYGCPCGEDNCVTGDARIVSSGAAVDFVFDGDADRDVLTISGVVLPLRILRDA